MSEYEQLTDNVSQLGGQGDGPDHCGELVIYTIMDRGPVTVVKSRYGP